MPLFQVVFTFQNEPWQKLQALGLELSVVPLANRTAKFDMALALQDGPDGFSAVLEYNTDLFDAATAERLMARFQALLEAEAYDGPSLIIAYSHCIAHGYDMKFGLEQQQAAVVDQRAVAVSHLERFERKSENIRLPYSGASALRSVVVDPDNKVLLDDKPEKTTSTTSSRSTGMKRSAAEFMQ